MADDEETEPAPPHRSQPYRPLRRAPSLPDCPADKDRRPERASAEPDWLSLVELSLDWQGLPCRR